MSTATDRLRVLLLLLPRDAALLEQLLPLLGQTGDCVAARVEQVRQDRVRRVSLAHTLLVRRSGIFGPTAMPTPGRQPAHRGRRRGRTLSGVVVEADVGEMHRIIGLADRRRLAAPKQVCQHPSNARSASLLPPALPHTGSSSLSASQARVKRRETDR
jgi:hypothetical protein